MSRTRFRWLAAVVVFAMTPMATLAAEPPPSRTRPTNVLILTPDDVYRPLTHDFIVSFRSALALIHTNTIYFYTESLDFNRAPMVDETNLANHYRSKYAARELDLVLTIANSPLEFMVRQRDAMFPGVPVVFASASPKDINDGVLPDWVTGVPVTFNFAGTLELALRLQPEAREVVVVVGTSAYDQSWIQTARPAFALFESRAHFRYLNDLALPKMLDELALMPKESIIFYLSVSRDAAGHNWTGMEVLKRCTAVASAPVYSVWEHNVGIGGVGGVVSHVDTDGSTAAALAARVLAGERNIPVQAAPPTFPTVDWRQMQRWNLREASLPPGSEVRFRTPTLWEQYKWQLIGIHLLVLAEAALIVVLVRSRRRSQRLTRDLKTSESHLLENRAQLKDQLDFERLMTDISSRLMRLPAGELGPMELDWSR